MLKGKTALVTGSTSGIGQGIAEAFAAQGCNVVLNGIGDASEIERLRAHIGSTQGVAVRHDGADMSELEAIAGMMDKAIDEFGAVDSSTSHPSTNSRQTNGTPSSRSILAASRSSSS